MIWHRTASEQPQHLVRVIVRDAAGREVTARWAFCGWWVKGVAVDAKVYPEWRLP